MAAPVPVVAHAGGLGWDELLFLGLPVLVVWLLLRTARRKAAAEEAPGPDGAGEGPGSGRETQGSGAMIDRPPDRD